MKYPWSRAAGAGLLSLTLLRPAAGEGSRAGETTNGSDAVLLEENLELEIASDREARVRYLNRTQVLTPRGVEKYGVASIGYNPSVTIQDLRASVLSPTGNRVEVKKNQISDSSSFASFELYSDSKQRDIHFPGVAPGSVLEYRYEERIGNLFFLPREFLLQEDIPARSKTLTIVAPSSFPLPAKVILGTPLHTEEHRDGNVVRSWRVKDVPAFQREADMPPEEDALPRISIFPKRLVWGDVTLDAGDWDGIARWYWQLARGRMEPTDPVAASARSITAGTQDPDEKARRIYEFLQQKITYVAIELGIGGWQPHENGQVLLHRYGDCKDKATLFIAMLRSVGLDGFPVLIRTRDAGLMQRDFISPDFNHAIVAIPRPDGYLFLDPTSESTPFGDLPWTDQGVPVLVIKADGRGDLVETPVFPPERNRRHRLVTARVTPGGDLEGTYVIDSWGQRRASMAGRLGEGRSTEAEDLLAGMMAWLCPGAVLKEHEVSLPSRPEDPLRIRVQFQVPRFLIRAGSLELLSPHLARFPLLDGLASGAAARRSPVFFPYLFAETAEVRLGLPSGRSLQRLPVGRILEGPGVRASTAYELTREGEVEVLVMRRSLTVSRREVAAADYPSLREFTSALAKEDASAVTLATGG